MGDWYIGPNGRWTYDPNAPSPSVEATAMMPAVSRETPRLQPGEADEEGYVEVYEREDGAIYGRVDPGWFEPFDEVDSRTIVDDGDPARAVGNGT